MGRHREGRVAQDVEPDAFYKSPPSGSGRRSWLRWFAGLLAACAAMVGRGLLTQWLAGDLTLIFLFPAVALVGLYFGAGPAIFASLVCAFWMLAPWSGGIHSDSALQASVFLPAAILVGLAAGHFQFADQADPTEPAESHRRHPGLVPRRDSVLGWLRVSMVLAAVLPTAFFMFAAAYSYRSTFEDTRLWLDGTARVTQEHASKVFQINEVLIDRAIDALGGQGDEAIRERKAQLQRRLLEIVQAIDHLHDIRIWDADGRLLASSGSYPAADLSIAEDDLFRSHRIVEDRGGEPQPALGRLRGEKSLQFSQRRSRDDGSFAGIVTLGINPGYFAGFYEQFVRSEPGLAMSLAGDDGTVLARWPPAAAPAVSPRPPLPGQPMQAGLLSAVRQLPGYPFRVEAAISRGAVISKWYRNLLVLAAFTFPTALALILVSSVAMRRARREREAVEQLRDESVRRLQMEESLRQSQKLEAIGRMTGGVAHDVNNLLMVIGSNLHLIRRLEPRLAQSPQLAAIAKTAKTGERLMRQLLAFSRRQALNPEVIRLQDRMAALVALVRTTLGGRVTIDVKVDEDTAPIEVDTAELELAMLNLAVNARDAMPDQGELAIRARNLPPGEMADLEGRFVELSVADTGTGIAPEDMPYVLEPFFTTKAAGKGTGLGLSQVYGLCAQAGGTVRVESTPGKGTRIRMFFEASDKPLAPIEEAPAAMPPLSCRVLLVEDHHEVAEATQQLLASLGCSVLQASSGEQAQRILAGASPPFDVLLSDIAMPGDISGIELANWVRQKHPRLAVVLMTGYTAELRRAKGLSYTVLQKPVSPQTLAAELEKARRGGDQAMPRR